MPLIKKTEPEYFSIVRKSYIEALKAKGMSKEEIDKELEDIRKKIESEVKIWTVQ